MGSIFTKQFFVRSFIIATFYLVTVIYLMNFSLVKDTIVGTYPWSYKFTLLFALLTGMWTAMTHITLFILMLNSMLTGAIVVLLTRKVEALKKMGKLRLVAGGSSLLAIAGSGCTACGLPILSLVGLGGAAAYLPFKGTELLYIAFALLLISFYLLVKSMVELGYCVLPQPSSKAHVALQKA